MTRVERGHGDTGTAAATRPRQGRGLAAGQSAAGTRGGKSKFKFLNSRCGVRPLYRAVQMFADLLRARSLPAHTVFRESVSY